MSDINELVTAPQRRNFFRLVNKLGYDAEQMKERAKQKYGLTKPTDSFNDLTKFQVGELIEILKKRAGEPLE